MASMKEIAERIDFLHFVGICNTANFYSLMEKVFLRMLKKEIITKDEFDKYMEFIFKDMNKRK